MDARQLYLFFIIPNGLYILLTFHLRVYERCGRVGVVYSLIIIIYYIIVHTAHTRRISFVGLFGARSRGRQSQRSSKLATAECCWGPTLRVFIVSRITCTIRIDKRFHRQCIERPNVQ